MEVGKSLNAKTLNMWRFALVGHTIFYAVALNKKKSVIVILNYDMKLLTHYFIEIVFIIIRKTIVILL